LAISKILNMKDCGGHFHGKHLKRSLDYVMNPEKTQDGRLVGSINCQVDSAFEQMRATKRKFGKVDKRQGYHIILSFKEDEVNPDTAFEITRRFVEEYLGKSYEAVYVVHDNTAHVHSHIVFNSVSFVDGKKYRYEKGRAALYRVSEFLGIKKRLLDIRENVRGAIKTTDKDIAKTALLAKGFREAGQTVANAFRTFADNPEVDYSQKEQKHPITKAVLAPMKAVKKMLVSMELHLDASIDKLDNLAMNVQLDKEKHMENEKKQEQTEPERAEAERVEAEVVYSPMVAEPQEYQYNADAFEARGVDEVKQEAAHKEVSKVREDKAR